MRNKCKNNAMKKIILSMIFILTLGVGKSAFSQQTEKELLAQVEEFIRQGQALSAVEQHKEAFFAFEKATSLDPSRYDVWGMKAMELARLKMFDDALECINKAVYMSQNNPALIYTRACIYCLKGDKENALYDLKKSFERMPQLKICARMDTNLLSLWNDGDFFNITE